MAMFMRRKLKSDIELRRRRADLIGYAVGGAIVVVAVAALVYAVHTLYVLVIAAAA
jgi:hypothetical protein